MVSKEEALAELARRGIDPSTPISDVSTSNVTPEQAREELRKRGVNVDSPANPSSLNIKDMLSGLASNIGNGALNVLSAPFQATGESIRFAQGDEPFKVATANDPSGFRVPSILQQAIHSLRTPEPPADPFMQASMGLKGLTATVANLPNGIQPALQTGKEVIQSKPNMADTLMALGLGVGTGEAGNAPFNAAVKATKGVIGLVPKFAKYANIIKDVNPEVVEQAEKFNVPITAAGQTGGGTQASVENVLSRLPFSKDVIANNAKDTLSAIENNVRKPLLQGVKNETEIAPLIQESIANASDTAYKNAQSLYQNAVNALPENTQIPLSSLQSKAKELLDQQGKLKELGAESPGVMKMLNRLSGSDAESEALSQLVPKGASQDQIDKARQLLQSNGYKNLAVTPTADYGTLQSIRAELNNRIAQADSAFKTNVPGMKFQSSPEAGVYKQLKSALDSDLNKFSEDQGGAFKSAFDQANSVYSQFKQAYKDNKVIRSIISEQDPVKVIDKALNLDNPNVITALKTNLPQPVLNDLQAKLIQGMSESKPGQFSPARFVTQYDKYGEDKLTDFFGPIKMEQIKPLYILSKAATQAERIGANPSGTAQGMASIMGLMAPLMQAIRGHPLSAAAMFAGEAASLPLTAKGYISEPVTNLLTNRTNVINDVANQASKLAPAGKVGQNMADLIQKLQEKYDKRRKF